MLYSAHLVIADNLSWNQPNHGKTLIEKDTFIADSCHSRHNFLVPHEKFKPNLSIYSGHPIPFMGK